MKKKSNCVERHFAWQASARKAAAILGVDGISKRVGPPRKTILVSETVSEKARRVWTECNAIMVK